MIETIKQIIIGFALLQLFVLKAIGRIFLACLIGALTGIVSGSIISLILTALLAILSLLTNNNLEISTIKDLFSSVIGFFASIFILIGFVLGFC